MHSHLIVQIFEGKEEAASVYDALQRMRGGPLLGLENAAVVTKTSPGRLAVYQKSDVSPSGEDTGTELVSSAIDVLFGDPSSETVHALVNDGFDDRFREQVARDMGDSSSALLILLTRDSEVDRSRLVGILTLFKGRVFETTLPLDVVAALGKRSNS